MKASPLARKPVTSSAGVLSAVPLVASERKAVGALAARRDAISRSEANARCHLLIEAVRELWERVEAFLEDVDGETGTAVLEAAGLQDVEEANRFGSLVFAATIEKACELRESLEDFVAIAGADLPPLPSRVADAA